MNEMNDKYTIEVLKASDLALLVGGSGGKLPTWFNGGVHFTSCVIWILR